MKSPACCQTDPASPSRPSVTRMGRPLVPACMLAILPKCPLCWAGYSTVAASMGISAEASYPWVLRGVSVAVGIGLLGLWRRGGVPGALTSTAGAGLIVLARFHELGRFWMALGIGALIVGAFLSMLESPGAGWRRALKA